MRDKVIVQSEKMRQVYVDVMTEFSAKGMAGSEGALSEKQAKPAEGSTGRRRS